jgi:hypothetical protein
VLTIKDIVGAAGWAQLLLLVSGIFFGYIDGFLIQTSQFTFFTILFHFYFESDLTEQKNLTY